MNATTDLQKLHNLWLENRVDQNTDFSKIGFNELTNSIVGTAPFYYYVIDFSDMSLSNVSPGIEEIYGLDANKVTFKDVLSTIHPDDIDFVSREVVFITRFFREWLSMEKLMTYKINYSFRSRMKDGEYALFNHQAVLLSLDEDGGFGKFLNIHTRIGHLETDHLDELNTGEISFIGLNGEPSYMNMNPEAMIRPLPRFSTRERRILRLIADGLNNSEISEEIFIGVKSVKIHRQIILKKTDCKNITQLVNECIRQGVI